MKRYVNIYRDGEGRFISDIDFPKREDAESIIGRKYILETVRLLSKEEEDAINELLKQSSEAWATLDHNTEEFLVSKLGIAIEKVEK
jgi:hypothetical protein